MPSRRDPSPLASRADRVPTHKWTPFELTALASLICQGVHRHRGGALEFATRLNRAVNGSKDYGKDIDIDEVAIMLETVLRTRPAAIRLIQRQPQSRLTRVQRLVFDRALSFDGSLEEWHAGRGEVEMGKLSERQGARERVVETEREREGGNGNERRPTRDDPEMPYVGPDNYTPQYDNEDSVREVPGENGGIGRHWDQQGW